MGKFGETVSQRALIKVDRLLNSAKTVCNGDVSSGKLCSRPSYL